VRRREFSPLDAMIAGLQEEKEKDLITGDELWIDRRT